ncbi:MAG: hypothetical protein QOG54_1581 [Actinomycetota bacterium]|jgi:uncharacterized Ntn-hydrolase superfamily protein|nr:hypothetical protein [Actinomycetota bacterium]
MTFSIVAWDPTAKPTPEWGVAVASKFLAVGNVVPWLRADVGAVATQALANLSYGPEGLQLLTEGLDADAVVERLTAADDGREDRQLGVVDGKGKPATFTGSRCFDWAGGMTGEGYCCQGNILVGPEVVEAMATAFEATNGELGARLLAALTAGDREGGDRRGRQSASLRVVREGGGYGGGVDTVVDLRVDDHPAPIPELERIYRLQALYFPHPDSLEFVDIDEPLGNELRGLLGMAKSGTGYDPELRDALFRFVGTENLEERWTEDAKIERAVLDFLRRSSSST